ncbi:MAG: ABC transporter-related protein [Candidatus Moranbacteria bacterium GW2011_GWE1_35_17]|nr:MAG: ABC transporter-related protein [Candidatus Moranbacteria bacterium GW2011_GWE1_35_17]
MTNKNLTKNSEIAISVKNVSKTFRIPHEKITSVKGAVTSLFKSVKKGEFFGIIGRNGSGKSTLLKILAGIYQADSIKYAKSGAEQFHGVKVNGMISPFLELGIGFNPELSGRDNVYLNATVLGMTKKQIDAKFDDIVKFSELERFIDQKLKNYSSGMQVRLAFSVSIHANRDILLMDEVLAVGDTNFQSKCLEEFNKYREMGRTVIIVTHDISVVERYCSRAMLLRNGKIVKFGKADEVANEYLLNNMIDEEKRTLEILNNKKEEQDRDISKKNKIAEVKKISFMDIKESIKSTFKGGEIIKISVVYNIFREINNPIYGITILNDRKDRVFVTNTERKNILTGAVKEGTVEVIFSIKNYLAKGRYTVSPAIANDGGKIMYDWKDDFGSFVIFSREITSGIVNFNHEIIIK